MPRKNLTARFCETVKVEERTDFQDDMVRGLSLRVSPNGTKTWNVVYTRESDSSKQRVKLGRFPTMTLEKARTGALKMVTAVSEGHDPSEEKRARRDAMTVKELGGLYIDKYAKRNKKTWAEDERLLKVEVYPEIGQMKALAVKRRDILNIIEAKAEAGHLAQSTQILAVVRKMFNWAVDGDYISTSPAIGVKPRGKAVKRDRVLSDGEVRAIWKALPDASLSSQTADIFRLLFLTGQRSGEVCGITRNEIDTDRALWSIPKERTKNGLAHIVPLSPAALAIVEQALDLANDDEEDNRPLFTRIGDPIESNAIAKAARLKMQIVDRPWTPHDIRRTVATGMAGLGVAPHIVEAVLNHISGFRAGVAGVYNRNQYEREKRRALDVWAEHVVALAKDEPSKIFSLAKAQR
ncbi:MULTISPECIES: tyrosine-type recombinase/integrase [unclassified Phyllobacterium]|uniref:tyrosine-type recombinase/integrase n=1 Tax=unclassified Phyllobacterium TaxID=2638441 RepID=UPI00301300D1